MRLLLLIHSLFDGYYASLLHQKAFDPVEPELRSVAHSETLSPDLLLWHKLLS